jgi:hypothetical protein
MIRLQRALAMWGRPEFEDILKESIRQLDSKELPLQAGLAAGSYALDKPLDVMVISATEKKDSIETKIGIFYRSLLPGCACAGDPTAEDEENEYCVVIVSIDKHTAATHFELVKE